MLSSPPLSDGNESDKTKNIAPHLDALEEALHSRLSIALGEALQVDHIRVRRAPVVARRRPERTHVLLLVDLLDFGRCVRVDRSPPLVLPGAVLRDAGR